MPLTEKLHPDRFTAMSGKMTAIVAYVLGESWTEPEITALSVTSDGFVTTDAEFMGEAADLDRNLLELSVEERAEFERLYRERVDDWRPVLSGPMPVSARLTRPDFGAPGASSLISKGAASRASSSKRAGSPSFGVELVSGQGSRRRAPRVSESLLGHPHPELAVPVTHQSRLIVWPVETAFSGLALFGIDLKRPD